MPSNVVVLDRQPAAPPPPAPSWVERLLPSFEDIRVNAPMLAPIAIASFVTVVGATAMRPAFRHALGGAPGAAAGVEFLLWFSALVTPLLALGKALALGAMAWAVLVLSGREVPFRPVVSLLLYGEAILASASLYLAGVYYLRGVETLRTPADLQVVQGIDLFVPSASPTVAAMLQTGSLFHIVWFGFLALGLTKVARVSRGLGVTAAVVLWAALVAFAGLRAAFA